jgi:hypothetical protein
MIYFLIRNMWIITNDHYNSYINLFVKLFMITCELSLDKYIFRYINVFVIYIHMNVDLMSKFLLTCNCWFLSKAADQGMFIVVTMVTIYSSNLNFQFFDLLLYDEISKEYSGNSFKLQKFTLSKNI